MTTQRAALAFALAAVLAAAGCAEQATTGAGTAPETTPPASSPPATLVPATPPPTPSPVVTPRALPTDLADGKHFAYLKAFSVDHQTLTVDVVQFLTGAAAEKAAQEDGQEAFDYYVRNQNERLRTLSVTKGLLIKVNTLTASESGSSSKDVTSPQSRLASFMASGKAQTRLFWFRLDHGMVVELREQYLP